jgi:hypothetical protein
MKLVGQWLSVVLALVVWGSPLFAQTPSKPEREVPWGESMSGPVAEVSLYLLRPYFTDNPGFTTTTGAGTNNPAAVTTDFPWFFKATPAFSLGWMTESGLGLRTRYFTFHQSAGPLRTGLTPAELDVGTTRISGPVVGLPTLEPPITFGAPGGLSSLATLFGAVPLGDRLTFNSKLIVDSWDIEAMCNFENGLLHFTTFVGVRYLHLSQSYQGLFAGSADTAPAGGVGLATEQQSLLASHNFNGAGPTTALQAKFHLLGGLSLFGNARGALLFGTGNERASFSQTIKDPSGILLGGAASSSVNPQFERKREYFLPVAELELGLEYGLNLSGSYAYVRSAVFHQTYFGAGSASQTDGNLGLFGVQFTLGLEY